MIVFRRLRDEGLWTKVATMASTAGHRVAGAIDLGNVVDIDVFGHLIHQASCLFFILGVICKVEAGFAVRANILGIDGVAGLATGTELAFPLLHDFMDLFARQVARQHLEISGCREAVRRRWRRCSLLCRSCRENMGVHSEQRD